jgi:hypothetical protein
MTGNADPMGDAAATGDGVMSGNNGPTLWLSATPWRASGRGTRDSVPPGSGGR